MPEKNRLNLSHNLDQLDEDFLKDVQAAAKEVKKRQEADKVKEVNDAKKAKTNKYSAIIIGAAAVILILIAYFVVFGRQDNATPVTQVTAPAPKVTVNTPAPTQQKTAPAPTAPTQSSTPATHDSQVRSHPQDSYEQPSDNPGM